MDTDGFTTDNLVVKASVLYGVATVDWRAAWCSTIPITPQWDGGWYTQYEFALAEARAARQ